MKNIFFLLSFLLSISVFAEDFEDIPGKLAIGANQAVRRNAADTAFEAYNSIPTLQPTATPQTIPTQFPTPTPLPTVQAGSVLIGSAAGKIASEDATNFHYEDSLDRLDVMSTMGSEQVSNGTFTGNSSGWTLGSGFTYSSNTVVHSANGTATLNQNVGSVSGELYLLAYTISALTVGTLTPSLGGVSGTSVNANGTYTERFIATSGGNLIFTPSNTARFTIDNISVKRLGGGRIRTGNLDLWNSQSNSSPGTTRMMSLNNQGSGTFIDFNYNGILRESIAGNSSGGLDFYSSGGNYFGFYGGNSGLNSNSLFAYSYPSAYVHYGYGAFNSGVNAGSTSSPTSTLQTNGGLGLKVKRITTSQSLDNTATIWICDASSAAACSGNPSNSCGYHGNEGDCNSFDAHGGCYWYAGNSCSAFNGEYGMGTCSGTSGCSSDLNSCSGGDEYSCLSNDDSYGGSCSWSDSMPSCSGFDESTCSSYSGSGCYSNYFSCNSISDNITCSGHSGCSPSLSACSWDGMSDCYGGSECDTADFTDEGTCMALMYFSSCDGSPFDNCSGNYSSYSCTGNYFTGNCSGTYGASCSGASSCSGINDSSNCGSESGCSWASVLNLQLPSGEGIADRTYLIKNDSSGGADCVIIPYTGEKVEKANSLTLGNYQDSVMLSYYKETYDCSNYLSQGACEGVPLYCSSNFSNCSYDTNSNECNGNAICPAYNGDQSTCEAQTYFNYCSGLEVKQKNWYKLASIN